MSRVALENDPANPCIGCGPVHPFGLRLAFEREGDTVQTTLAAAEAWQGAPGRLHSAILSLAMMETANWTVFGLLDRVGLPTRTSAIAMKRVVAVGEVLTLSGKRAPEEGLVIAVEARDPSGALVATLERAFDLPDAEGFRARMGYEALPEVYGGLLPK